MVNYLIKALNDMHYPKKGGGIDKFLPRLVVVIPDWDIIKYLDFATYGVEEVFHSTIRWMITNFTCAIEAKKDDIFKAKPGALKSGEPKFIWVKVIKRMRGYDRTMTVRNRFNATLEVLLAEKNHHFLIDVEPSLDDAAYFTSQNELNADGRVCYWKEIDECIRLFEMDKLPLTPLNDPCRNDNRLQSAYQQRYKLPLIPPSNFNSNQRTTH